METTDWIPVISIQGASFRYGDTVYFRGRSMTVASGSPKTETGISDGHVRLKPCAPRTTTCLQPHGEDGPLLQIITRLFMLLDADKSGFLDENEVRAHMRNASGYVLSVTECVVLTKLTRGRHHASITPHSAIDPRVQVDAIAYHLGADSRDWWLALLKQGMRTGSLGKIGLKEFTTQIKQWFKGECKRILHNKHSSDGTRGRSRVAHRASRARSSAISCMCRADPNEAKATLNVAIERLEMELGRKAQQSSRTSN